MRAFAKIDMETKEPKVRKGKKEREREREIERGRKKSRSEVDSEGRSLRSRRMRAKRVIGQASKSWHGVQRSDSREWLCGCGRGRGNATTPARAMSESFKVKEKKTELESNKLYTDCPMDLTTTR